jgi:hypothetical protein
MGASDWHYGEVVKPGEISGTNKFNPDTGEARKLLARFLCGSIVKLDCLPL